MAYRPGNPGVWGTAGKRKPPRVLPKPNLSPNPGRIPPGFTRATGGTGGMRLPGGSPFAFLKLQQAPRPDYGGLIGGNPDLSELESVYGAMSRDDAAARDAALRKFAVSYGALGDIDPASLGENARNFWTSAIDAQTKALAQKAEQEGLSIHARQAKGNADTVRRIPAMLAARGLLRSGQTGYDLGEQAQNYKTQQYDTLNELLGNIEGTVGQFLSAERERQMALAQARMQAAWDSYGDWGDSYIDNQMIVPGGGRPAINRPAPRPAPVRGYFGTIPQTRRALNNRLRAGRM